MENMKDEIVIRVAKAGEAESIYNLMKSVHDGMADKTMFVCDTLEYVKNQFDNGDTVVVAECKGEIVGTFITRCPYDSSDNLGLDINLEKNELPYVMHMESTVVHKSFRGKGLQAKMIKYVEELVDTRKFKHLLATVAPDNKASLASFEKNGYVIVMQKKKYGDLDRAILYKKLV